MRSTASTTVYDPFARPASVSRRRWLQQVAGLALATTCGLGGRLAQARSLDIGKPAPPLVLHTIDGKTLATQDLHGQVVIIAFWASWCDPCLAELPVLSAYAERHAQDGLQVLGFSLDDPEDLPSVRKVGARLSFPVGLLGGAYAGDYGRIWKMPVSFVLDRDGRLADNGWNDPTPAWTPERLHRVVDPLLAAPARPI